MQEKIDKRQIQEIVEGMLEDVEDKKKTLIALRSLLDTNIAEEESIRLSVNAIYERYLLDTTIYTNIFKFLNLQPEESIAQEIEPEEAPTKKEQETLRKQLELQDDVEVKKKTLEEEAEEHEQQKFRDKMKETKTESVLDRLGLVSKRK